MEGLTLPHSGVVYIDTNTVIYAVEKIEPYASLLHPLWLAARAKNFSIVTSELTWLETLTKPLRDGNNQLERQFKAFLTSQEINLIPARLDIWEEAARLRGLGLRTPDALHAATALSANCAVFITNDAAFQKVSALSVLVLNQFLPFI